MTAEPPSIPAVPKAELHVHLEGTASPDLVRRLAARNGMTLPETMFDAEGGFAWTDFLDFLDGLRCDQRDHPVGPRLSRRDLRVPGRLRRGGRDLCRGHLVPRPRRHGGD